MIECWNQMYNRCFQNSRLLIALGSWEIDERGSIHQNRTFLPCLYVNFSLFLGYLSCDIHKMTCQIQPSRCTGCKPSVVLRPCMAEKTCRERNQKLHSRNKAANKAIVFLSTVIVFPSSTSPFLIHPLRINPAAPNSTMPPLPIPTPTYPQQQCAEPS